MDEEFGTILDELISEVARVPYPVQRLPLKLKLAEVLALARIASVLEAGYDRRDASDMRIVPPSLGGSE